MSSFNTQRSVIRQIVMSPKKQATIGEVMADATLTYLSRAETTGFIQKTDEMESDYDYTSKNSKSTATESRIIARSSKGEIDTRLDDFLAGYIFAFCMGTENFTAGTDSAPNTHVFTWNDTSAPASLTNLYVVDSTGLHRKWTDLSITSIVLSGNDKGSVKVKISYIGMGGTSDTAMVSIPALPVAQYLYGSDSIVSIGPAGTPASLSPRVASWEATFDHQNDVYRGCGTGIQGAFVRQGNVVTKLSLVIALDGSTDVRDWAENHTPLEVTIAATSGAASIEIDYPYVILPNAPLSEQDKMVYYKVDLDEKSILQPVGGGESVTVTVQNAATAYLVSA